MISDGIEMLEQKGTLLAAAPTGIGKTAASLAAALTVAKSGERKRTILFMTSRQAQHRIVVDTVRRINERRVEGQAKVTLVDLIGQKGMCIHEISENFSPVFSRMCADLRSKRNCQFFLQEAPGLRLKVLQDPLHVEELVVAGRNHREAGKPAPTCPWKVARESAKDADVVVCDYNHLFNDNVREASLNAFGLKMEDCILVIDEAHNLPERIRMGLRAQLSVDLVRDAGYELEEHLETTQAKYAKSETQNLDAEMADILRMQNSRAALKRIENRLRKWFGDEKRTLAAAAKPGEKEFERRVEAREIIQIFEEETAATLSGGSFKVRDLMATIASVKVDLDADVDESTTACERLLAVSDNIHRFRGSAALCLVFTARRDTAFITTHLLDPSEVARPVFDAIEGAILMSGTLTPPKMYADLLGIPTDRPRKLVHYRSPFEDDRRPVIIARGVTSKYTSRGPEMTRRIHNHMHGLLKHTPGHVAVFCPSYAMLEQIVDEGDWPGRRIIIEDRGWSKQRADKIVEILRNARNAGQKVLLAGVYGGRLSEGMDFSGNLLDAVICVGLQISPPSVENKALRTYFDSHYDGMGFRYASSQPAVNRMLQAMGRAIRKADDRAVMLLLEDRLLQRTYSRCLPETLTSFESIDPQRTGRLVKRFFKRHPEPARATEE